jgi:hypothetical protein
MSTKILLTQECSPPNFMSFILLVLNTERFFDYKTYIAFSHISQYETDALFHLSVVHLSVQHYFPYFIVVETRLRE